MKSRVLLFFAITLPLLAVVPAFNLWSFALEETPREKTFGQFLKGRRNTLYRIDASLPTLYRQLYFYGLSTDPKMVIIGYDDWLFLGDLFEKTISRKRWPATDEDLQKIQDIAAATMAWRDWLTDHGVRLFMIQIAPDKASVYADQMPGWARPVAGYVTDALIAQADAGIYLDSRRALVESRESLAVPVFYRTDTHWNNVGGWLGYRDLVQAIRAREPAAGLAPLAVVAPEQVWIEPARDRTAGDLGDFLRIQSLLHDLEIPIRFEIGRPLITEARDFNSGEQVQVSDDTRVNPPTAPLLLRSPNALNQARLLWLRDSFGIAMSPFIAATFSESLHLHYSLCPPEELTRLVDTFRPDYVIVTVVERAALSKVFTLPPPRDG